MGTKNPLEMNDEEPLPGEDGSETGGEASPDGESSGERKPSALNANTLLLFGLLAAVGLATYLMVLRAGSHVVTINPAAQQASVKIGAFLNGGVAGRKQTMLTMLHDTEKVKNQFDAFPMAPQVPLSDLTVNPFLSPLVKAEPAAPLSDDAVKRAEDEQRQNAAAVLRDLKLESIIYGPHSVCMISGKTYSAGQGNGVFTISRILPDGVQVLINGTTFDLKLAPPRMD